MTVGPIPNAQSPRGKEIVARYSTPLRTNATFFTDSNVREFYKRERNFRPSWPYTPVEPIAGNCMSSCRLAFIHRSMDRVQSHTV